MEDRKFAESCWAVAFTMVAGCKMVKGFEPLSGSQRNLSKFSPGHTSCIRFDCCSSMDSE